MDRFQRHMVNDHRENAIRKRAKALYRYILEVEPQDRVYPSYLDFALLAEFRRLIDAPSDVEVSRSDFAHLKPLMDRYAAKWIKALKKDLRAKIRDCLDGIDSKTDPLDLAVGFYWRCRGNDQCKDHLLSYPHVLAHRCLRFYPDNDYENEEEDVTLQDTCEERRDYMEIISDAETCCGLDGNLRPDTVTPLVEAAKIIVEKFGMDPRTATATQMDNIHGRLRLYSTRDDNGAIAEFSKSTFGLVKIFTWRAAVSQSVDSWHI